MRDFGDLIEGGIESPLFILLLGEPGTAKFFIGIDFIFEGLRNGKVCVYFCVDRSSIEVRRSMKVFGDAGVYEKEKKLIFIDAFAGRSGAPKEEFFIEDPYDLSLYDGLLHGLRNKKIDRVVFDSINGICFEPEQTERLMRRFQAFIEEVNAIGLFIAAEGGLPKELETTLRHISGMTLRTYKKDNENFIRLEQMRVKPHNSVEGKVVISKEGVTIYRI